MRSVRKNFFSVKPNLLKEAPEIFRGKILDWPAVSKWKSSYLMSVFQTGNTEVHNLFSFKKQSKRDRIHGQTTQSAFSKILNGDSSQRFYLTRQPLLNREKVLLQDIEIPEWVANKKFYMSNIWIGQDSSLTPLHYDSTEGYLCQIAGYKRVYLLPPEDSLYLYPKTPLTGGQFNLSEIIQLHDFSVTNYPYFLHANLRSVLLKPGDSLYIPQGWWHQVFNLSYSLAVNFFFTNEERGYSPKQEILMYQACKTPETTSAIDNILRKGNYDSCIQNALSLLDANCLEYASYFALSYFEEYLKAHLADLFFSKFFLKEDETSRYVQILVTELYNSRQSESEKYYANIEKSNAFLEIHCKKAHIPNALMKKWVNFSKEILKKGSSNLNQLDVQCLIREISNTCIYKVNKNSIVTNIDPLEESMEVPFFRL